MNRVYTKDGIVYIPFQDIVDFAYSCAVSTSALSWDEMEIWHQEEINKEYGIYTEKVYEDVPQEEIEKYEDWLKDLLADEDNY